VGAGFFVGGRSGSCGTPDLTSPGVSSSNGGAGIGFLNLHSEPVSLTWSLWLPAKQKPVVALLWTCLGVEFRIFRNVNRPQSEHVSRSHNR
jgi:hypothetical protein